MNVIRLFLVFIVVGISTLVSFGAVEVIGSLVDKHTGMPGDTYTGTIKIHNSADTDQEVKIYQSDYLFNHKGESFYNEPGSQKRSNARWIELNSRLIILKTKETQNIQYQIKIPEGDALKGTYWSVLMVEGVKPVIPGKRGQLNISTSTRYAVQVVTNIGNTGIGELKYTMPMVVAEGEHAFLDVVMENTGERLISPVVTVELFNENGESVKVLEAPKNGMYPSTSSRFRFDLMGIEAKQNYQAVIVADGGNDDVFGLELPLKW